MSVAFAHDPATAVRFDADQRLPTRAPILNATIAPYKADELPDAPSPYHVYRVLRPADELRKASQTFCGVPIVREHVNCDAPVDPDLVVGCVIGTKFLPPYLIGDLIIWDADAIRGIQDGSAADLSAGYAFTTKWRAGDGYDAIQSNLRGHHVALVDNGRNGADVSLRHLEPRTMT